MSFQITLQLTILICALMFIFFGMPPLVCLCAIPVILLFIFLSVYSAYFNKAMDLCNVRLSVRRFPETNSHKYLISSFQDRPQMCWVAELHYRGVEAPKNVTEVYSGISEQKYLDSLQANRCRKMVNKSSP